MAMIAALGFMYLFWKNPKSSLWFVPIMIFLRTDYVILITLMLFIRYIVMATEYRKFLIYFSYAALCYIGINIYFDAHSYFVTLLHTMHETMAHPITFPTIIGSDRYIELFSVFYSAGIMRISLLTWILCSLGAHSIIFNRTINHEKWLFIILPFVLMLISFIIFPVGCDRFFKLPQLMLIIGLSATIFTPKENS